MTMEKNDQGMSYQQLISQLKSMRDKIQIHKELTGELHLLDTQYYYICSQERKGLLQTIDLPESKEKT